MYTTGKRPMNAIRAIQSSVSGARGNSTRLMLEVGADEVRARVGLAAKRSCGREGEKDAGRAQGRGEMVTGDLGGRVS